MKASNLKFYKSLFLTAAVYDLLLGIAFLFFTKSVFDSLGISEKLPEFDGYLHLIGGFLFVIGIGYYLIYKGNLLKNRDLILVGALFKLAYFLVSLYYFYIGDIPHMLFFALFGVIDFIMFVLMFQCYNVLGKRIPD